MTAACGTFARTHAPSPTPYLCSGGRCFLDPPGMPLMLQPLLVSLVVLAQGLLVRLLLLTCALRGLRPQVLQLLRVLLLSVSRALRCRCGCLSPLGRYRVRIAKGRGRMIGVGGSAQVT